MKTLQVTDSLRFAFFVLFLGAMATLSSCKKDDKQVTPQNLISAKPWIVTGATVDGTDAYGSLASCVRDDVFRYNADGSYTLEEGDSKCDASDPQIFARGNWTYDESTQVLVMTQTSGAGFSGTVKVTELTASKLTMEYNGTIGGSTRKVVQQLTPIN